MYTKPSDGIFGHANTSASLGAGWALRLTTRLTSVHRMAVKDTRPSEGMHLPTEPLAERLREKRSEMMLSELEGVALRLFDERGFNDVTVQEIADETQISVRTFYRYCPTKEDVLQLRIDQRSEALRAALSARPRTNPRCTRFASHSLRRCRLKTWSFSAAGSPSSRPLQACCAG